MRKFFLVIALIIIAIILLGAVLNPEIFAQVKSRFTSSQQTAEFLRNQGWGAVTVSIGLILVATLVPIVPFIILASANVLVFGLEQGFVISWTGAVLGAISGYWIARFSGRTYFSRSFGKYSFLQALQSDKHGFRLIFAARLLPLIPNSVVNYGAGLSPLNFSTYLWATLLGKMPIVAWECLLGHDLLNYRAHTLRLSIMLVLTVLFLLIIWRFYPSK